MDIQPDMILSDDKFICAAIKCQLGSESDYAAKALKWCYADRTGVYGELKVGHTVQGKPFLPHHPDIYISLSTCKGWAAAAVACCPIGVDIEADPVYDDAFAKRICSKDEYERLKSACDKAGELYHLWTQKESVLKCSGIGLQSSRQLRQALEQEGFETQTMSQQAILSVALKQI